MTDQQCPFVPGNKYKMRGEDLYPVIYEFLGVNKYEKVNFQAVFTSIEDGDLEFRHISGLLDPTDFNGRDFIPEEVKEPMKVSGWVNVYNDGNLFFHSTKPKADEFAGADIKCCVYVSGTEGVEP